MHVLYMLCDLLSNTLFRMCVLKHSSWMNPLALRPVNALIRLDFSLHTRRFIPKAARLLLFIVCSQVLVAWPLRDLSNTLNLVQVLPNKN
jgi:hypothetical protein